MLISLTEQVSLLVSKMFKYIIDKIKDCLLFIKSAFYLIKDGDDNMPAIYVFLIANHMMTLDEVIPVFKEKTEYILLTMGLDEEGNLL